VTRLEGEGRVAVITPGHNVEVWLQPGFQTLLRNGLAWCIKGDGFTQKQDTFG
jgi:type 1 glutamine amidotransferase